VVRAQEAPAPKSITLHRAQSHMYRWTLILHFVANETLHHRGGGIESLCDWLRLESDYLIVKQFFQLLATDLIFVKIKIEKLGI